MTYEKFIRDLGREFKRLAVEPVFSMGELVFFLAVLAFKLPWWLAAPLMFVWIVARNTRIAIADTHPKGRDTK